MAVIGLITDIGIQKAGEAQANAGWYIYPWEFGVSEFAGAFNTGRTGPDPSLFYKGPIAARVRVDHNTIKFICTVPPGVIGGPPGTMRQIREISIWCKDQAALEFFFSFGQPNTTLWYSNDGSTTLECQIAIDNVDLSSTFVFNNTQAVELVDHNLDPGAHPEVVDLLNRHGLWIPAGSSPTDYNGQQVDQGCVFDGVKASNPYGGLVWTAKWAGPEGNSILLTFTGSQTADDVRAIWNNANPYNTVEHNGTGSEVMPNGSVTLVGGSLAVDDYDFVYKDVDGKYKKALADGTIKSNIAGLGRVGLMRTVISRGFIKRTAHGFPVGDQIFLSPLVPGEITTIPNDFKIGHVIDSDLLLIDALTPPYVGFYYKSYYHAVVGSAYEVSVGLATHTSIASAILDCPTKGSIRILPGTYTEASPLNFNKEVYVTGGGRNVEINVDVVVSSNYVLIDKVRFMNVLTVNSNGVIVPAAWMVSPHLPVDNGVGNDLNIHLE